MHLHVASSHHPGPLDLSVQIPPSIFSLRFCLHFVSVYIFTKEEFVNSPNSIYLRFIAQIGVGCIIATTKPLSLR